MPEPAPVQVQDFHWQIITEKNIQALFNNQKAKAETPALVAISIPEFEQLNVQIQQLKSYIDQQNQVVKSYRNYYEGDRTIKDK